MNFDKTSTIYYDKPGIKSSKMIQRMKQNKKS